MDHLARPLEELQARASQFVASDEARVLYLAVDEELAEAARELVVALEWHPENRGPLFTLTVPFIGKNPGWPERQEALRLAYQAQAIAYDHRAIGLPPLQAVDPQAPPQLAFAASLAAVAKAFTGKEVEARGILVVLAPGHTPEAPRLAQAVAELAAIPALAKVRWIWLDPLAPAEVVNPEIATRLGGEAWLASCRIDRAAQKQETDGLVAGLLAAAGGASLPGAARPRMAPPPHPSDVPAPQQPLAPPAAAGFVAPLLLAVQALRAGKPDAAFDSLQQARDTCLAAGSTAEAVDMELLLGTVGAEVAARRGASREPVLTMLENATRRAEQAGLHAQAAKAGLVLGCFARLSREAEQAGRAFVRGAGFAAKAGLPLLQFHALRLAGEVALEAGLRPRTQALWKEALDLARSVPSIEAAATGLTASVDELTAAWRQHGFTAGAATAADPTEAAS